MLKQLLLLAVVALVLGASFLLVFREAPDERGSQPEPVVAARESIDQFSSAAEQGQNLDLALKEVSLSQGEGGFELWRLKAEWANVRQQGEFIFVEQPRLTYFMSDDGKVMHVSSSKGDINQKSQVLRFINNVRIIQEDKLLTGDLLVYDGSKKTMMFPDGGDFKSAGMSGNAEQMEWNIDNKLITAEGGVNVLFDADEDPRREQSVEAPVPQAAPQAAPANAVPRNPRASAVSLPQRNANSSQAVSPRATIRNRD